MSTNPKKFKNFILGDFKSFAEMKQIKIPKKIIKWALVFLLLAIIPMVLTIIALFDHENLLFASSMMVIAMFGGVGVFFFSAFLYMMNFPASRLLLILTMGFYNYCLTILFFQTGSFKETLMFYPIVLGLSILFVFFVVRLKKVSVDLAVYIWNMLPALCIIPIMFTGLMALFSFNLKRILVGVVILLLGYFMIKAIVLSLQYRIKKGE